MFKNILVAYDGSAHAREAARIAATLARLQTEPAVLWVVTVMDPSPWSPGERSIEMETFEGQTLLKQAAEIIGSDLEIHNELLFGSPADSILQVAETRDCDLIVIGTRGQSLLKDILLGSQAQKVISSACCPVMIVK